MMVKVTCLIAWLVRANRLVIIIARTNKSFGLPPRIFKCVYFLQQILIHVYSIILPIVSIDSLNILHNIYS